MEPITNEILFTLHELIAKMKVDADTDLRATEAGAFYNEEYDKVARARNWIEQELNRRGQ